MIIVKWENATTFNKGRESPEGLLLCHDLEQAAYDEVEALNVANLDVTVGVGRTDALNCFEHLTTELFFKSVLANISLFIVSKEVLISKGAWHINFDLMPVKRWKFVIKILEQ